MICSSAELRGKIGIWADLEGLNVSKNENCFGNVPVFAQLHKLLKTDKLSLPL